MINFILLKYALHSYADFALSQGSGAGVSLGDKNAWDFRADGNNYGYGGGDFKQESHLRNGGFGQGEGAGMGIFIHDAQLQDPES